MGLLHYSIPTDNQFRALIREKEKEKDHADEYILGDLFKKTNPPSLRSSFASAFLALYPYPCIESSRNIYCVKIASLFTQPDLEACFGNLLVLISDESL